MATHSSILFAWRIPWAEEPGGLRSQRVGHGLKRLRPSAQGLQDPSTVQEALTSEMLRSLEGEASTHCAPRGAETASIVPSPREAAGGWGGVLS